MLLALLLNLYGCIKGPESPQLPPATHTGANILACKVNGKVIISTGAGGKFSQPGEGVIYELFDTTVYISALGDSLFNTMGGPGFSLQMSSPYKGLGTYTIVNTHLALAELYLKPIIQAIIQPLAAPSPIPITTATSWQAPLLLMQQIHQGMWCILPREDLI